MGLKSKRNQTTTKERKILAADNRILADKQERNDWKKGRKMRLGGRSPPRSFGHVAATRNDRKVGRVET
jgi:hypothetical protein